MTVNEESSVEKRHFPRRRFPLVPITEDSNILPESGQRVGVLGTQSAKQQHTTSESSFRIRRALQRRSFVPSLVNTECESKLEKTNTGISPSPYSSGENQDGNSVKKPQESFIWSDGMPCESQFAGRRRRSKQLWQKEGSLTKETDEESDYCHQGATIAQVCFLNKMCLNMKLMLLL